MTALDTLTVLDRQLLLQLGDRLKRERKAQGLGTVEMARRAGISRTTLGAVESGDPSPSMGTYLRVMSALGVSGELALLAGSTLYPSPPGSAAARSRRARPVIQVLVSSDESRHRVQDLQSLALHQEAIRAIQRDPALFDKAKSTLHHWLATKPNSRTASLWQDWERILMDRTWRKVLGHTRRAQELRQASPLPTVLPADIREHVLSQVNSLKKGIVLGEDDPLEAT